MGKDYAYFQPSLRDERLRSLYPAFKRRATLNASLCASPYAAFRIKVAGQCTLSPRGTIFSGAFSTGIFGQESIHVPSGLAQRTAFLSTIFTASM